MKRTNTLPTRAVLGALLSLAPISALAAETCTLEKVAEWQMNKLSNVPIFDGRINGQSAAVLVDTSSPFSAIDRSFVREAGIPVEEKTLTHGWVNVAKIKDFSIGGTHLEGFELVQAGLWSQIPVVLGNDFLGQFAVELAPTEKKLRLFRPRNCENSSLAYWAAPGTAARVTLEDDAQTFVPIEVNGVTLRGFIASGSRRSIMSAQAARKAGIDVEGTREPAGCFTGIGPTPVDTSFVHIDKLVVGSETIHQATLRVAPFTSRATRNFDVLLGMDFLRAHRIMLWRAQRAMYLTHLETPTFSTEATPSCADRKPESTDEKLARYDRVLENDPRNFNARYARILADLDKKDYDATIAAASEALDLGFEDHRVYGMRGEAWAGKHEYEKAYADYTKALQIEPRDAVNLANRGRVASHLGRFDEALADYDAALQEQPGFAQIVTGRGLVLLLKGDFARSAADYERALLMDPKQTNAARGLTIARYAMGDFPGAYRSAATWMKLDNGAYAVLWRYLAAARSGANGFDELRDYARDAPSQEWPMPIVRMHLGDVGAGELLELAAREAAPGGGWLCEARFHLAQRHLAAGETAPAREYLEKVVAECPKDFEEYVVATAEMPR